jgi:ribosomal protein S19E (S16A)
MHYAYRKAGGMRMADIIEQMKNDIERYQSLLEQLESGGRIGDSPDGRSLIDRTQEQIDRIKHIISELQAIVDSGERN